jgi:hypothetical protein
LILLLNLRLTRLRFFFECWNIIDAAAR